MYSPVACIETVRTLIAVETSIRWDTEQVEIKGSFLYTPLEEWEHIWMIIMGVSGIPEAYGREVK